MRLFDEESGSGGGKSEFLGGTPDSLDQLECVFMLFRDGEDCIARHGLLPKYTLDEEPAGRGWLRKGAFTLAFIAGIGHLWKTLRGL